MLRALGLLALVLASSTALAADGKSLFDGKTLEGWKGNPDIWSVKDGALTATTAQGQLKYNTFLVWQGGDVKDFELTLKYKIVGGNSGIQYRSELMDPEKFIVGGYQADIDSSPTHSGINYEEKKRAILCKRGEKVTIGADGKKAVEQIADAAELQKSIKNEDWNDYKIVARGNHLQHFINGKLMSDVTDEQSDKAAKSGILALQAHQGPPMVVQFKDIVLTELK
jgi:hypothetical protein